MHRKATVVLEREKAANSTGDKAAQTLSRI